ncbi:hypothetical protein SH2C18_14770 [Clostridium sediminicola]|uniref:DUF2304 domain-containing protein n=1 Tax=Clostridium sediminicola TaxID=3114879 RepID=UPI0031F2097A
MSILVNIGAVLTGIILIIFVLKLMVNKNMTESQSVLWLIIGVAAIILGFFPSIITVIADSLGIWYPPSIIFLIGYIGLLFIVLKNTVVISIQSNQIRELFMQVALLNTENEKLKEKLKLNSEEVDSH